jgi:FkbM family methyltransferase
MATVNFLSAISESTLVRRAIRMMRIHKLANAWLRRFPCTGRLPGSRVLWRATRVESIPLAHEMFEKGNLYDPSLLPEGFTTFADLGCNVGYFTCWLAHQAKGRTLRGLMLDANPDAVNEARWHAEVNGLRDVQGVHGILGEASPTGAVDFFLYESNICSTSQLPDIERSGLAGKWTRISVPCISLETQWAVRHGAARCHVLKVDIEGSELNFLKAETVFLRRVDSIFLEWHKWRASLDDVCAVLETQGFANKKVLDESADLGTAFFIRA